eukprot:5628170-Pleurochrysis_carterae.AAC.1
MGVAAATRGVSWPLEQPGGALLGLEQLRLRLCCQRGRRSVSSRDSWSEHRRRRQGGVSSRGRGSHGGGTGGCRQGC